MNITVKTSRPALTFDQIKPGQVFRPVADCGEDPIYYLKIEKDQAIDLDLCEVYSREDLSGDGDGEIFYLVNAEMTIED